jgi:hypothetical protein
VRSLAIGSLVLAILSVSAGALVASNPSIESANPPIAQRGTTFDLQLAGSGFHANTEFMFYRTGIACSTIRVESETSLAAQIVFDKDCPLGAHPYRIRTSHGISELRLLHVTPFATANETEPNNDPVDAQSCGENQTLIGVLPGADTDFFRITRKKGERISAEVQGIRLGIGLFDAKIRLIGPDGQTLVEVDDTPLFAQDPYFTILAPVDGDYVVEVANSSGEGDDNSIYALHLGSFPRPDRVYPTGGRAGETISLQFQGDARGAWKQEVVLPAVPSAFAGLRCEQDGQVSPTATPFRVVEFGNVLEAEPNQSVGELKGDSSSLPIAFNGVLQSANDVDLFRFSSKEGELISFETFAAQLGSMTDTVVSVLTLEGNELARNDDSVGLDSRLLWKCSQTGEFVLRIQDKRGAGGELNFYRIEASVTKPSITSFLARRDRLSQAGQMVRVPRGNRVLALVGVRRDGWSGAAEVDFPQLPPGVTSQSASLPADQYLTPVVFEAPADAPLVGQLITGAARAATQNEKIEGGFEQMVDLVASSADRAYQIVSLDQLAMTVTDPAPFRIRLTPPTSSLPRDGSLDIAIEVDRDPNFQGAIEITFPFLPSWVDGPEKITISPDAKEGVFRLRAHPEVALQRWPLVAEGKVGLAAARDEDTNAAPGVPSYRRRGGRGVKSDQLIATQLVSLDIAESPISGAIGEIVAESGKELTVTIPLKRRGTVPQVMTASLVGLTARVVSAPVQVTEAESSVTFKVTLADDAPLGEFANLHCELTGKLNGQSVIYCIGRGGSMKIVRPGDLVADASGRVLSKLEILRKSDAKTATTPDLPETKEANGPRN